MSPETLQENRVEKSSNGLEETLSGILEKFDPDVVNSVLTQSIKSWIAEEPQRYRPRYDLLAKVQTVFVDEGPLKAIEVIARNSGEITVSDSDKKTIKSLNRKIEAVLSGKTEVAKGRTSTVLPMGGAAHNIMEELVTTENWQDVFCDKYNLVIENSQVIGLREKGPEDTYVQGSFVNMQTPQIERKTHRYIHLEYPLERPAKGVSVQDWVITTLHTNLTELVLDMGALPGKPYDVSQIIKSESSRANLMKILGVIQYVYCTDEKSGMNLVEWNGDYGELNIKMATEFKTLNWLTIVRKLHERAVSKNGYDPGFVELPVGEMRVVRPNGDGTLPKTTEKVSAKKIDLLRLSWKNPEEHKGEVNLEDAIEVIKGRFNSQKARYRRKDETGESREISTLNLRNVRTLFKELYKIYGESIFTDLIVEIDDFKFPGGDGGWFTQFNEANLPLKDHFEQVSKYLFRVAAQLQWVERWAKQDSEHRVENMTAIPASFGRTFSKHVERMPIDVGSVTDFILRMGLNERIFGVLRYQTPAREHIRFVELAGDHEDLLLQGNNAFKRNTEETNNEKKIVQALAQILGGKISELKPVEVERPKLPEVLKEICIETEGGIYLCIDLLSKLIETRLIEQKEATLRNGVVFTDKAGEKEKAIEVVWIDNLIKGLNLRIAVDDRGRFTIANIEDPDEHFVVHGKLLTEVYQQGVLEFSKDLADCYFREVWMKIPFGPETVQIDQAQGILLQGVGDWKKIITPEGISKNKIPGKPADICKWNPMGSNVWFLDPVALKEYVESDASKNDKWGLHDLAVLVNEKARYEKQLWCPQGYHDNQETKAATWYGQDDVPHLQCRGECGCSISLHKVFEGTIDINAIPLAPGLEVGDYVPVSRERHATFDKFLSLAEKFAETSGIPYTFLAEVRGLDPENDIGRFGFFPWKFTDSIQKVVHSEVFKRMRKDKRSFRIDQLRGVAQLYGLDEDLNFCEGLEGIRESISEYIRPEDAELVWGSLSLENLSDMRRRGLVRKTSQMGGRLILPTYFVKGKRTSGMPFAISNVNARGIKMNGQELYEGVDHIKAKLSKTNSTDTRLEDNEETEVRLRNTPAGYWHPNWDKFFLSVAHDKRIVIVEGPLSAASLARESRIDKIGIENCIVAALGTGYLEYYALLKFLGVKGYNDSENLGLGIEEIILAYDIDKTGFEKWKLRSSELTRLFPEARIMPIQSVLSYDLLRVIPDYEEGVFAEGGPYHGIGMDFNDILNTSGPKFEIDSPTSRRLKEDLKVLRPKYAFRKL